MDRTIPKQFSVTRAQPNFQALLDAAPDAMVGVDPQGKIVMANVQTEELFGYRREELIGQPIEVLVPERVRAAHPAHRTGYFDHPRTRPMGVGLDLAGRRADGTEFPAEISLSAIDTDNDVLALAAIRDITDRKRIEADTRRAGGEVRLSCGFVEQLHRTSIIDTGLGISEENVDDLFKPFARLGADRLGIEGTGLGLALSKGLIENMEGRIGFSSQVGTGSTFWVELPLADRAEVEAAQAPPPGIPTATSAPARTVLYVEDNLANLQLIEAILVRRPSITLLSAMQ